MTTVTDPVDGYTVEWRTRADLRLRPPKYVNPLVNLSNGIFAHHADTAEAPLDATWRGVQAFHQDARGWADVAYSFGFGSEAGRPVILEGRGWDRAGGHTAGFNSTSLAFCFVGNGDLRFPEPARRAFVTLMRLAERRFGAVMVRGHRDVNPTACPGRIAYQWLTSGRPLVGKPKPPPPPPSSVPLVDRFAHFRPSSTRTVRTGSAGTDVVELQFVANFALSHLGLRTLVVDGQYGPASVGAVLALQREYNQKFAPKGGTVVVDGVAGAQTRHVLVVMLNAFGVWG